MTDENTQLTLTDTGSKIPLQVRFELFDATNPHVYRELAMLARRAKRTGASKIGIAQLWEVLRWRHMLSIAGDEYLLNNSFRAFYSRALMDREADLDGFFETRRSIADEVI